MTFSGDWPSGPMQKVVVTMLALRLEEAGSTRSMPRPCATATRPIMFLGGESNHGKSMGQIEACRRGALLVSTETTVIDEDGVVVDGSKRPFLKKRNVGTERADKAAPERGVEKFFGEMPTWELYTEPSPGRCRHRPRDRRQLRPLDRRDDPVRAAVPDVPLAPELLPAQRAARARATRCRWSTPSSAGLPGRPSSSGSPSVPTTSSAPQRRRCCWTRWSGSSSSTACARSPTSGRTGSPTRSRCWQRRRRRCDAPLAGRRHRPDHPHPRRLDPAGDGRRRQGHRGVRARHPDRRRLAAHRRPDHDDRPDARRADPARLRGAGRGRGGRRVGPDPQPGDARREHLQRVAGGRHRAGAARLRGAASSRSGRAGDRTIPLDDFFVRSGVTTLARGRARRRRSSCRCRPATAGRVHARRTRRRGHDLASVTLAVRDRRRTASRGCRTGASGRGRVLVVDETGVLADPTATDDAEARTPRRAVRRRGAVADLDAREPRVPARDAARAGRCAPSGDRHASGSPRDDDPHRADRQRPRPIGRRRAAPHAARGPARRPRR